MHKFGNKLHVNQNILLSLHRIFDLNERHQPYE